MLQSKRLSNQSIDFDYGDGTEHFGPMFWNHSIDALTIPRTIGVVRHHGIPSRLHSTTVRCSTDTTTIVTHVGTTPLY